MLTKPPDICVPCPIYGSGLGYSNPEGTGALGVAIIGEGLGAREEQDGLPFRPHADAGSVLQRAIKLAGFDRSQFVIHNCISCRPPGNVLEGAPYEVEALACCRPNFERVLTYKPKVFLALGNIALRLLTGMTGDHRSITYLRGYVLQALDYPEIVVVPSYHPSYLKRGAGQLFRVLVEDIRRAVQVARGGYDYILNPVDDARLSYQTDPMLDDAEAFYEQCKADPSLVISYDIETDFSGGKAEDESDNADLGKNITLIQFSTKPGTGIAFPWLGEYIEIATRILALPNDKVSMNGWLFDEPTLNRHGAIINGKHHDIMWMHHHCQPDLPADLQFIASLHGFPFPWKHYAGPNIRWYGCADVDSTLRVYQSLLVAMPKLKVWDSWLRQRVALRPRLERMKARGVGTSAEKLVEFGGLLQTEIARVRAAILPLVPAELQQFKPFRGIPKDVREFVDERLPVIESSVKATWVGKMTRKALADALKPQKAALQTLGFEQLGYQQHQLSLDSTTSYTANAEGGKLWAKPLDFNPGSWQQVLAYAKHRRHKIPVVSVKQNGLKVKRESVNEKALLQLSRRTRDPFYRLILDYREPVKMKGTYVGNIETRTGGFMPGADGRIRADWTYRPANGQLATRNGPPLMTIPKHGPLAKQLRRAIVAKPGCSFVNLDYKSFHVLTLGFEAGDATYMRLAQGDMHSFFATALLGLESPAKLLAMDDAEMVDCLKHYRRDDRARFAGPKGQLLTFQQVRDQQAKPTILGYGLGMQANRLWEENDEFITSKAEAQRLIDTLEDLFPLEKRYRRDVRELAHRQHYLLSRYGYIRWFWNVLQWNSNWQRWEGGPDSEAAISHYVQNDAFGMMYDVMLALGEAGLDERFGLILNVHDSLVFECPDPLVDECLDIVRRLMETPSKVLVDPKVAPDGLSCRVECSVGRTLGDMEEVVVG